MDDFNETLKKLETMAAVFDASGKQFIFGGKRINEVLEKIKNPFYFAISDGKELDRLVDELNMIIATVNNNMSMLGEYLNDKKE